MTTAELLRKQAKGLARRIDGADEVQLRRIAFVIAQAAVARTALADPVISEALAHLENQGPYNEQLQDRVSALTENLDEKYFELQESEDDADEKDSATLAMFTKARAANTVAAALGPDARTAAAEAAYEAIAATNDVEYLTAISDKAMEQ